MPARSLWRCPIMLLGLAVLMALGGKASAARIILKNGMILEGEVARLGTLIANPAQDVAPGPGGELIVLIDDNLRRTYVSLHQVQEVIDNAGESTTRIEVRQPVAGGGHRIASLGRVLKTDPWDKFGRRTIKLLIQGGPADVIQGISLVTPKYFRVETLSAGRRLLIDQRYATSNLSSPLLREILYTAIDRGKANDRLRIYRLFLEADRYATAEAELQGIIKDFPKLDLEKQLQLIRNLKAGRGLTELKFRDEAGQREFARSMLEKFPSEGIAGATLVQVREIRDRYQRVQERIEQIRTDLTTQVAAVRSPVVRERLSPMVEEIRAEINTHTLVRLGAFLRLVGDDATPAEDKLALAVSGWLLGADDATDNLPVAMSLVNVRALVGEYLREEVKPRRSDLVTQIRSEEGGIPRLVAKLLAHMKPPLELPDAIDGMPGYFSLEVPGRDRLPDVPYLVQLPPEYDPYRRYPVVVTLHGAGTTAEHQIDWWAGDPGPGGTRLGQGARHGYIVIAPKWAKVKQLHYEYSAREHAAVLNTLRDACRRFSVDMDRVFLSGHSMGGDAAWDMGLAHPDLWAGVIPIVATADSNKYNYNALYWRNSKYVPFYFLGGELDGDKMVKNAYQFDRYLNTVGPDVIIANYQGRGHESFHDDVLNLYEWMGRQQRDFFPKNFACETIRSWDNYFWWIEMDGLPANIVANPANWPPRRVKTLKVSGKINSTDDGTTIYVSSGRGPTTVWLAPQLVDFDRRIRVIVLGHRDAKGPTPDVAVILEDARTRGDRMHPFWARLDLPLKL